MLLLWLACRSCYRQYTLWLPYIFQNSPWPLGATSFWSPRVTLAPQSFEDQVSLQPTLPEWSWHQVSWLPLCHWCSYVQAPFTTPPHAKTLSVIWVCAENTRERGFLITEVEQKLCLSPAFIWMFVWTMHGDVLGTVYFSCHRQHEAPLGQGMCYLDFAVLVPRKQQQVSLFLPTFWNQQDVCTFSVLLSLKRVTWSF